MSTWKVPVHKTQLDAAVAFVRGAKIDYALPMPKNPASKRFHLVLFGEGDAVLLAAYLSPAVLDRAA